MLVQIIINKATFHRIVCVISKNSPFWTSKAGFRGAIEEPFHMESFNGWFFKLFNWWFIPEPVEHRETTKTWTIWWSTALKKLSIEYFKEPSIGSSMASLNIALVAWKWSFYFQLFSIGKVLLADLCAVFSAERVSFCESRTMNKYVLTEPFL